MARYIKVRTKLIYIISGITAIAITISFIYLRFFTEKDNLNERYLSTQRITTAIETIIQDENDLQNIGEKLSPLIISHQISSLILYDKSGVMIYAHNEKFFSEFDVANRQFKSQIQHRGFLISKSTITLEHNRIIGSLLFAISLENSNSFFKHLPYLIIVLACLYALLLYILIRFFIMPVEKIKQAAVDISQGETELALDIYGKDEFGDIAGHLRHLIGNIAHYLDEISNRQTELVTAIKDAEQAKHDLNIEADFMSQLHSLSNEYRRLKNKIDIFNHLGKDICNHFSYQAVLLYKATENHIVLFDAYFRGLTYLRDTYLIKYSNYIVPGEHDIYKIFDDHTPFFTGKPPCFEELEKANLPGHFAIVPLLGSARVWAVVAVGFLENQRKVSPHDVEKLMLFLNTIGLTLDTIENVEDLEIAINIRTKQLEIANHRLSRSMVEKNEFLRAISHDLNAPLRNIVGLIDSIIRKYESEINSDLTDRLNRIRKNIHKELELINELLELSRVKSRKIVTERIEVTEMIDQIIEKFQYEINGKHILIERPDDFPVMYYDRYTIRQIFQNLIDNAVKYMKADSKENSIKINWQQSETHFIFSIMDTGIGIQEKEREKIFSIFFRGNNELNIRSEGKGVGLAMIKTLLENLDGEIWVESEVNKGSTFYFTVPIEFAPKETETNYA
jgi:signal transduction histidine kinase